MKKTASRKKAVAKKKTGRGTAAPSRKKATGKKKTARKKAVARKKAAPKRKAAKRKPVRKTAARRRAAAKSPAGAPAKSKAGKMTARELKSLREALLNLRERLSGQVNVLKQESLTRNDSVFSLEDGTDAFDRQFGLSLANSENEALQEVDEALRRLDEGMYGICEECGGGIEKPRLKALPFVRTCIQCQSEIERRRGGTMMPRFVP
ncbi:MAG: TraR/DksA family transcriptional regulator [Lentisphaerae bacterium]|nr:TraR/DksA family transcriptional regulator [Lentisphaerota bacterium]